MNSRIIMIGILLLLFAGSSFANQNRYDPFVDLNHIDWFDRELYFAGFDSRPCVDLEEFYAYADSDPYDKYDREDVLDYRDRLSADDYYRLADENRGDNIDRDDLDDRDDYYCSTRAEFNDFADSNRYDDTDRDDFFHFYGYDDEDRYLVGTRHPSSELRSPASAYIRADGYGGYASSIRPRTYHNVYSYSGYDYSYPSYDTRSRVTIDRTPAYGTNRWVEDYFEQNAFFGKNPLNYYD